MSRNYESQNTAIEVSTRIYGSNSGYFSVEDFLDTATKIEEWLNKGGGEGDEPPMPYTYINTGLNIYRYTSLESTPDVLIISSQKWAASTRWKTAEELIENSVYRVVGARGPEVSEND